MKAEKPGKTRRWLVTFWISCALVVIPTVLGIFGYVTGTIRAFEKLKSSGAANPEELANDISLALNSALVCAALATLGTIGLVVSLIGFVRAKRHP